MDRRVSGGRVGLVSVRHTWPESWPTIPIAITSCLGPPHPLPSDRLPPRPVPEPAQRCWILAGPWCFWCGSPRTHTTRSRGESVSGQRGSSYVFGSVATCRSQTRCYSLQGNPYGVGRVPHSYAAGGRREAIQRAKDWGLSRLRRPASRPSTPICSSRSGHSIAYPSLSNCQCYRSAGDPCPRRGYRANGTTRLRPSARSTVNLSSVTVTCMAMGSVSSTKGVMPRLKESCLVLYHKPRDTANLVCAKTTLGHERHRLQP
jgi:hypothetical protein